MAETSDWYEEDSNEREELESLLGYLDEQGQLDELDLSQLRKIADEERVSITLEGWQRIANQLVEQGEDELARYFIPETDTGVIEQIGSLPTIEEFTDKWTVFVGAGGSKPDPTNLPLVNELLPRLWKKASEINATHLLELQESCRNLRIQNIEDLLTAIDITRSAAAKPQVRRLVQSLLLGSSDRFTRPPRPRGIQDSDLAARLQETTQVLFSLLVGMMRTAEPNAFHDALVRRAQKGEELSIVTTNYDVCIERALDGSYRYGGIDDVPGTYSVVLKLHGSLNWFACRSCDRVVAADLDHLDVLTEAGLFPVVSQCPECAAMAPHLIVPPVGNKVAEHPALLQIRQEAEEVLKASSIVSFVGYSFNEADEYVLRMVSRAVTESQIQILVFDTDGGSVDRLKSFLAAHARGFDPEEYVTFVSGDAAETFPVLVDLWEKSI